MVYALANQLLVPRPADSLETLNYQHDLHAHSFLFLHAIRVCTAFGGFSKCTGETVSLARLPSTSSFHFTIRLAIGSSARRTVAR